MRDVVANYADPNLPTIEIDCYGRSYIQDLTVSTAGWNWRFLFDEVKKPGRPFSLALYLDRGVWLYGAIFKYPRERRIFVLEESPNESHFHLFPRYERYARLVLTHERRLLERGGCYRRVDYGLSWINEGEPLVGFDKDRMVSFIGSIEHPSAFGYSLRKQIANELIRSNRADCYGRGIREIQNKAEGLTRYAFSICMENTQADYYYTEKLIDCFLTETVPIYWGCPSISEIFDCRGILMFNNWADLNHLLPTLNWERYQSMRPFVLVNQRRVATLLLSNYRDHYTRVAKVLAAEIRSFTPVAGWQRTKFAAGCRFLANGGRP